MWVFFWWGVVCFFKKLRNGLSNLDSSIRFLTERTSWLNLLFNWQVGFSNQREVTACYQKTIQFTPSAPCSCFYSSLPLFKLHPDTCPSPLHTHIHKQTPSTFTSRRRSFPFYFLLCYKINFLNIVKFEIFFAIFIFVSTELKINLPKWQILISLCVTK